MKVNLKCNASLKQSNTNLSKERTEVWLIIDNTSPIDLGEVYEKEEMPILDESYIEKSHAWHMYFAQVERQERKKKWEKVFTNLSTI